MKQSREKNGREWPLSRQNLLQPWRKIFSFEMEKKTQNHFQSYSHFILSFCTDILTTDYKNSNTDSMIFCTLLFERCWHVQANTIKSPGSFNIKWALDSPILICSSGVVNFTDKLARLGITPSTLPGFFFNIQPLDFIWSTK